MTEFEKVFWEGSLEYDYPELLAVLRDRYYEEMLKYSSEAELILSPYFVMFAIAKILENNLIINK
jgi:hypothetical protein